MPNRYLQEIKCNPRALHALGRVLEGATCPRASALSPYVLYLGMVYVFCVTAEFNYRLSIVTCYGNRAKTCTAPHTRPFVALPLNNIF